MALLTLSLDRPSSNPDLKSLSNWQSNGIKLSAPVGNLVGQLLFGWLADRYGRKRMYGIELIIMISATFCQALAGEAPAIGITGVLIVWRFIMGIGIGGDYPLSAIITSEFAATENRGRLMTVVFAFQGWGQLTAAIVGYAVVSAYKDAILNSSYPAATPIDYCWRLLIGIGCVPGVIALYFRLTIPETPRFIMDVERNVVQATEDIRNVLNTGTYVVNRDAPVEHVIAPMATHRDMITYFSRWENLKILVATAYSWFALDVGFYGLGLNSSYILTDMNFGNPDPSNSSLFVYETLRSTCIENLILSAGLVPGYWATFLFIDSWGRRPIQLMGFIVLTILFLIMGFAYDKFIESQNAKNVFLFLYCLADFFQNFGPNTTTFIIPGEAFPTRYRSTAHGISAASGKLGAIVAQLVFGLTGTSVGHILQIFAFVTLTGVFSTTLLPETAKRTLEDISNEPQEGYITGITGSQDHYPLQHLPHHHQ